MLESVQVRLEIVKTLLTQAHFFQLEPAGASITEVAEPLVDWILTGSSVDADRVNPIGAAARQAVIQLEGIRRQADEAARSLRELEEDDFGFGWLGGDSDDSLSVEDWCRRVEQQATQFQRLAGKRGERRYRQAMRLIEEARRVARAEIGPERRQNIPECDSASIETIPEHAGSSELDSDDPEPPTSRV